MAAADLRRRASAGALAALIDELRLGGRVELAGKVRDIEAELEAASVFALSSRIEGLPLALLEAMAKGLAVVSFDNCAGPREVIEHGADGLLVPGGDERALARAICALIESPALRRRLGAAARRKAAAYAIEAVGPRWDALVESLRRGDASLLGVMTGGPGATSLAGMSFRADVEGLRAVAIAIVVLAHARRRLRRRRLRRRRRVLRHLRLPHHAAARRRARPHRAASSLRALLRAPGQAADAAGADRDRRGRGRRRRCCCRRSAPMSCASRRRWPPAPTR